MKNRVDKRAFLVVGPESSGTKFLTNLFVKAGCEGEARHKQRLDKEKPTADLVVFRRSYPHGGEWPDLEKILLEKFAGYEVRLIVIMRHLQFTLASRSQHAGGDLHGRAIKAFQEIGRQWAICGVPGVWVTYEALCAYPSQTVRWLMDWCGLDMPKKIKIKDGNEKYV